MDDLANADLLLGELGCKEGAFSRRDLGIACRIQSELLEAGIEVPLGKILVDQGYISQETLDGLVKRQRRLARRAKREGRHEFLYGRLAIKNGFATRSEVTLALKEQILSLEPRRIGEILMEWGVLGEEQHQAILDTQKRIDEIDPGVDSDLGLPALSEQEVLAAADLADQVHGASEADRTQVLEGGPGETHVLPTLEELMRAHPEPTPPPGTYETLGTPRAELPEPRRTRRASRRFSVRLGAPGRRLFPFAPEFVVPALVLLAVLMIVLWALLRG